MSAEVRAIPAADRPLARGTLARGTLARNLVIRVAILVASLAIVLAALSSIVVGGMLIRDVDDQLMASVDAGARRVPGRGGGGVQPRGPLSTGIEVRVTSSGIIAAIVYERGSTTPLTEDELRVLLSVPVTVRPTNVTLPERGEFRAIAATSAGETHIVALPMSGVRAAIQQLVLSQILITVLAVSLAVAVTQAVIRHALRPLNRLAQTATEVSRMELDRGEVDLIARVSAEDADPNNEVGQVEIAFNYMLTNVDQALAARQRSETQVRQFVADASHELRNPLAAIRGYAELTRRNRTELPPDAAYAMGRIEAESQRMSSLVEDMLLLARLDNERNSDVVPVDLVEVVLNAVSDAQAAGPQHRWLFDLGVPEGREVIVMADANQMHQVIGNLLSNARKHTPAGTTVRTSIRIQTDPLGGPDQAILEVADDGPGIPEQIRDHVFERFARADVARTHDAEGSTGLGLSIVAAVVQAHGGQAAVTRESGWTRFTVKLPLRRD